jgi:hypothetical protein
MCLPTSANQAPAIGWNGAGKGAPSFPPVMRPTPAEIAVQLTSQQKVFLFCVASGTDWKRFNIPRPTVQFALLKSLIERPERHQAECVVTDLGRAVLDVLLQNGPR